MRLNIKDIELANISRFRAQQMGVAMLIIILFHVGLPRFDPFLACAVWVISGWTYSCFSAVWVYGFLG